MNLKPHTTNIINKTAPRIEKLRQQWNWGVQQAVFKTFYTSMIRLIIETGYPPHLQPQTMFRNPLEDTEEMP